MCGRLNGTARLHCRLRGGGGAGRARRRGSPGGARCLGDGPANLRDRLRNSRLQTALWASGECRNLPQRNQARGSNESDRAQ